ncbi:MAG: type II toxin-antitoxin system VapB family antitoxin [Actinomycetota bacterium]|nr:type II toxin-antitoxin system VapB family antitoxin [Actinomycetota bacterium]
MSRTNIDLPDDLVAEVMSRYDLPTKKSAVEFALRKALGAPLTSADIEAMAGVGWEGDLEAMRSDVEEW